MAVGAHVFHFVKASFASWKVAPALAATLPSSSEVFTSSSINSSQLFSGLATSLAFLAASFIVLGFLGELDQFVGALFDVFLGLRECDLVAHALLDDGSCACSLFP